MKSTFIFILVLIVAVPGFARLNSKQIVGKWKYEISLSNTQINGLLVFFQNNGDFKGENTQSDGVVSQLSNIKVNKKNKTLCFELVRKNDVPIAFILVVAHNKFKGKGWINDTNFEITGNKILI